MKVDFLPDAIVLYLEGSLLDEISSANILSKYETQIKNSNNNNLILDLTKVDIINSIGINILIRLLTKTRVKGGEMLVVGLQEKVQQVVKLTKLNDVFEISDDLNQAINILNQRK